MKVDYCMPDLMRDASGARVALPEPNLSHLFEELVSRFTSCQYKLNFFVNLLISWIFNMFAMKKNKTVSSEKENMRDLNLVLSELIKISKTHFKALEY